MEVRERYLTLSSLALTEFPRLVSKGVLVGGTTLKPRVLRLHIYDGSYLDVRLAGDDYNFHWERRALDGMLYRWDNAPHHTGVTTFPDHFHSGSETNVIESPLPLDSSEAALRFVLRFIEKWLDDKAD